MSIYKKGVSLLHRTAQPFILASFLTWGSSRELVVQGLPLAAKILISLEIGVRRRRQTFYIIFLSPNSELITPYY